MNKISDIKQLLITYSTCTFMCGTMALVVIETSIQILAYLEGQCHEQVGIGR